MIRGVRSLRLLWLLAVGLIGAFDVRALCEGDASPLFVCETERAGKFIAICAVEEVPGQRWSSPQYRFGIPEHPELVFPSERDKDGRLYFSHESSGEDYRVSVRFTRAGYTYRVYSSSGNEEAGVMVTSRSKVISRIRCIERPTMFPAYLRAALPCDEENPHRSRACEDDPYPLNGGKSSWR